MAARGQLAKDMLLVKAQISNKKRQLFDLEQALLDMKDAPYMINRGLIMPLDKLDSMLQPELPFDTFQVFSGKDDKRRQIATMKALITLGPEDESISNATQAADRTLQAAHSLRAAPNFYLQSSYPPE